MAALLNRAKMTTATTGTGTVTLGSASTGYLSFAEAGAANATSYAYLIEDGDDFEFGDGTYTSSGTTFSRDTVTASKIAGTAGTTKITLSGTATIAIVPKVADIYRVGGTDVSVSDGGTGVSSATAYAVLCGGTTSTGAHQSISGVGTAGQVLTSNGAGALPTFQDPAARGYTLLSTLTTTSGTTQSATGLGTRSSYMIVVNGVSFSSSSQLTIAFSTNNGSSYGTALNMAATLASVANVLHGLVTIPGASGSTTKYFVSQIYNGAASNNSAVSTASCFFGRDTAATAAVNAIQFAGGTFDAGSIEIWGL